ncbi:Bifunctional purine biosynthesis protein PurH [Fusobacterium sp. DD29]|uniref:bifunctional phosphoribosylaminoimidazolecarboxamide formyltransferase/IMP cyclohydrolase n=1 Tax=unclassified Fusobacterium TaxID=2648384 RepID=UPI001B8D7055|nr:MULTISPECIES: bifunctional phosphoribosylaminoimidazolecarboxamide formyltransferase/IMP cyclohydrolase [unclassified Fusobacterium]MBR8700914.1 Bifunctional purine biosynthesis protein PurH [Fusobacterium sp. DD45]MBR8710694.1 Bifunctional purine biosynthesis protein PurH [Fusobacterium sp. DD28]MBR8749169.1 Bifunctional purine biosynthesis protein PurH [Fusobacterium sp. DD29]MBR8751258.1 Bifunctional purine biosynthesis protein PurH [Fusobacterium sp. DD26]MBR8761435.1 Bifunctional purin
MKRALISVYDKTGVVEFSKFLIEKGMEIISTGGTYRHLKENGIPVIEVASITKAPEMLDGRVKTLHPVIHGGILAIRDNKEHMNTLKERGIDTIDMVVVNLYPFFKKVNEDISFEEKVEFIDIGGPTMLRSAAKSFKDVVVISDIEDYKVVKEEMEKGEVTFATRKRLAGKVFNLTSAYDAAISNFLLEEEMPKYLSLSYERAMNLRYGENPHQKAAYYVSTTENGAMKNFKQLNGKELSFNNIRDMDVAWKVANEFEEPACCGLKHSTPCGAALGKDVYEAYMKAYECDPVSIFGGIVALNREVDEATAKELVKIFLEIVIAPGFSEKALEVLKSKKNLRVIKCNTKPQDKLNMVKVDGGILVQDEDKEFSNNYTVVTEKEPTPKEMSDLEFGMRIVKHVKSNAIVVAKDKMAIGIGNGETNRIWPTNQAIERAGERVEGAILASDAFFPFRDVVDSCAKAGIKAIIQPGGSIRDKESIDACNENGIAMVFTGMRHFKH